MRLDSNIAKLTLEYWLLPLACCPTKVQNSTWKIDPSHQGAKFCVENRPISTHLTRVQNSTWKIDPFRQGAKFYVENRPVSSVFSFFLCVSWTMVSAHIYISPLHRMITLAFYIVCNNGLDQLAGRW
jgi:hypothetical protein